MSGFSSAAADNWVLLTFVGLLSMFVVYFRRNYRTRVAYAEAATSETVIPPLVNPEAGGSVDWVIQGDDIMHKNRRTTLDLYNGISELRYAYSLPTNYPKGYTSSSRDPQASNLTSSLAEDQLKAAVDADSIVEPEVSIYFDTL
jgi:hypothetical protein